MELRALELFVHLASTLHFGKTSHSCNLSPSALSRTIQRLEEEIGEQLFLRDKRSVSLTEVGDRFRHFARDTLDRWKQFVDEVAAGDHVLRGELTLFCSVTASYGVLSKLFSRFRARYPEVHIRLQTGDSAQAIEKVLTGAADLTVAAKPERLPKNLEFKSITVTPLIFISPLVACDTQAMVDKARDLNSLPWGEVPMIVAEQALSRRRVDAWFRSKALRPNIYAEVAGHEAILSMVRLGCGIGVVPALVLENSLFKNEVRVLDPAPILAPYLVGLCAHKRRLASPVVRSFWTIIDS